MSRVPEKFQQKIYTKMCTGQCINMYNVYKKLGRLVCKPEKYQTQRRNLSITHLAQNCSNMSVGFYALFVLTEDKN